MRFFKYAKEKNIGISELNILCENLFCKQFELFEILSQEQIELLNSTLSNEILGFNIAKNIIKKFTISFDKNYNIQYVNALKYLLYKNYFSNELTNEINQILKKNIHINNVVHEIFKLDLLINSDLFFEDNFSELTVDDKIEEQNIEIKQDNDNNDFRWGGLSGEEAEIGYWNCD